MRTRSEFTAYEDTQIRTFSDIVKSAYERGISDPNITTEEFVEELKIQLSSFITKPK